jgi:hypothetical protein
MKFKRKTLEKRNQRTKKKKIYIYIKELTANN